MECPYCGGKSQVKDSRLTGEGVRRRRECPECERRFTTYERLAPVELQVVKRSGDLEPFQADKLERAVRRVTRGDDLPEPRVREIVQRLQAQLLQWTGPSISSWDLAMLLLDMLEPLAPLAHHRLRANYTDTDGKLLPRPDFSASTGGEEDEQAAEEPSQVSLFG